MAKLACQRFEEVFAAHARLPIVYEDLIEKQGLRPSEGERICGFLGVGHHPMRSSYVKLNPESLADMVTNYDELAGVISRSEFAGLLSE